MSATEVITAASALVGGTAGLGLAAREVWRWYTARDAATLAARAKATADASAAASSERADVVSILREQASQAEARATVAADGRAQVAGAIASTGTALAAVSASVDRAAAAISDHDRREADTTSRVLAQLTRLEAQHAEILAHLRSDVTGEHRAAAVRGDS